MHFSSELELDACWNFQHLKTVITGQAQLATRRGPFSAGTPKVASLLRRSFLCFQKGELWVHIAYSITLHRREADPWSGESPVVTLQDSSVRKYIVSIKGRNAQVPEKPLLEKKFHHSGL